ncbi:unnamed protein product, partial [Ectocarpus sp. 8 AP-2014]
RSFDFCFYSFVSKTIKTLPRMSPNLHISSAPSKEGMRVDEQRKLLRLRKPRSQQCSRSQLDRRNFFATTRRSGCSIFFARSSKPVHIQDSKLHAISIVRASSPTPDGHRTSTSCCA